MTTIIPAQPGYQLVGYDSGDGWLFRQYPIVAWEFASTSLKFAIVVEAGTLHAYPGDAGWGIQMPDGTVSTSDGDYANHEAWLASEKAKAAAAADTVKTGA